MRGLPVDHRSDLFSFGGILYEMLTGRRPFAGATAADTISRILGAEPAELSGRALGGPAGLERVVRRCLEKEPGARFQSARDLAFALGAADSSVGSSHRPRFAIRAIPVLVIAGILLALVAVTLLMNGRPGRRLPEVARSPRVQSIAVLPLRDLSGGEGQEFLAAGVTEALTAELAGIRSLKVISNTSAGHYQGSKQPLREIARELGVDAVVEGSVARVGSRVKVTVDLIEARNDTHLWARSFERELGSILALEDEIAREVARQIAVNLSPEEEKRLARKVSVDSRAYEAFLMGRYFLAQGTESGLRSALEQFNRALEVERNYAAAHAALAEYYAVLPFYSALSPAEVFPKARAAAEKSLAIDETLPEAHASLAYIRAYYEWDWAAAEREFRRALELRPNYADAHFSYSRFLAAAGRFDESVSEIARARALDPRSTSLKVNTALLLYFQGHYDEALKQLTEILAADPDNLVAQWGVGLCYEQKGAGEAAILALQKAAARSESLNFQASLAHAYGAFGKGSEARRILASFEERARSSYVPSYYFALVYVAMSQNDRALEWLERAFQERSTVLAYLRLDPRLAPLRDSPRFDRLLEQIGLR